MNEPEQQKGIIFDIQRFSIHDGPGIRTTVFVKGCPLRCKWCSNPESHTAYPIVVLNPTHCIHCGMCRGTCRQYALDYSLWGYINRRLCINCGQCASVCIANALRIVGKVMAVTEVLQELKKDSIYYRRSQGGVTISGGEPLEQFKFVAALSEAIKRQGWNIAIETTGYGSQESLETVIPYADLVLLDIKNISSKKHKVGTGMGNEIILKNAIKIAQMAKQVIIRVPLIPGFNTDIKDFKQIVDFAKGLYGVREIHLLPYHKLGAHKYKALGKRQIVHYNKLLTQSEVTLFKQIAKQNGFSCSVS